MQTRHLGNSDLEITPIGIGAWAMGGGDWAFSWGPQEDNQSIAGRAHRPYVFTKCSLVWNDQHEIGHSLKAASVRRELEASLRRLRVDVIDLYQIHWPDPESEMED